MWGEQSVAAQTRNRAKIRSSSLGWVLLMSASEGQRVRELYEFGPFRVDTEKEILLRAGDPIPLTAQDVSNPLDSGPP